MSTNQRRIRIKREHQTIIPEIEPHLFLIYLNDLLLQINDADDTVVLVVNFWYEMYNEATQAVIVQTPQKENLGNKYYIVSIYVVVAVTVTVTSIKPKTSNLFRE